MSFEPLSLQLIDKCIKYIQLYDENQCGCKECRENKRIKLKYLRDEIKEIKKKIAYNSEKDAELIVLGFPNVNWPAASRLFKLSQPVINFVKKKFNS